MRPREQRQPDGVGVFLHDGPHNLLGRLVEARVDDFEAGVAKRPGDDLGASVVSVKAGLGHDDAVATFHPKAILGSYRCPKTNRAQDLTAGNSTKAIRLRCMAAATTTQEWKTSW